MVEPDELVTALEDYNDDAMPVALPEATPVSES